MLVPIHVESICIILLLRHKYYTSLQHWHNWCQPPLTIARRPSRANGGTPVTAPIVALPFRWGLTSVRPTPVPPHPIQSICPIRVHAASSQPAHKIQCFPGSWIRDHGFELRLESDFRFVVNNLIPPDENKRGFENELAFIEFSVIIHVVLMANHLNKNSRLVIMTESRKWDSVNRKVILSLNLDIEIYQMENYMKHFDDWRSWIRGQIDNLQQWNKNKFSKLCISSVTPRNIKISVFGFLYYAKDIFLNQ